MVTSAQIDGGVYGKVRYSMLGCDNVSRVKAFGTQELLKSPCSLYGITVSDAEFAFFTQFIKGKADKDKMPSLIEIVGFLRC